MPNLNLIHSKERNRFEYDLSHDFCFSAKIGRLIPVNILSCLPGDTIKNDYQLFARTAPLAHPMMQKVKATFHSFFVPYRLMYPNQYKKVLAPDANDLANGALTGFATISFSYNVIFLKDATGKVSINPDVRHFVDLIDYLGCPVFLWIKDYSQSNSNASTPIRIASAPILAYYRVYVDYFTDSLKQSGYEDDLRLLTEILESALDVNLGNILAYFDEPLRPTFNRDYFNTSQYDAQLGSPQYINMNVESSTYKKLGNVNEVDLIGKNGNILYKDSVGGTVSTTIYGSTSGFSINDLKELFARQKWADIGNQFGRRYVEQVLGHFGVQSSDGRLGRPDYVGSRLIPFEISEIANMTSGENAPLGELAGRGVAYGQDQVKDFFCEEHGIYITVLSIVPDAMYYQGLPKIFSKNTTFDFAFPEFAEIGEQEVLKSEICATQKYMQSQEVFGYQERYAEYKRAYNRVGGTYTSSMLPWTMAIELPIGVSDDFDINTVLSPSDADIARAFADQSDDAAQVYATIHFDVKRISTLPYIDRTIPMQL